MPPALNLAAVLRRAVSAPHEALARLARAFQTSIPDLREAEESALSASQAHERIANEVTTALLDGAPLHVGSADNRADWNGHPLAILVGLDRYLVRRYAATGDAPPARVTIDGVGFHVHRRRLARGPAVRHRRQTGHLQRWLEHHWVLPVEAYGLEIRIVPASRVITKRCEALLHDGEVRLFVGSFADGVTPIWNGDATVRATGLSDEPQRWAAIERHFETAREARANIVVLPELTVTPKLRDRIVERLARDEMEDLALVVPGSFHFEAGGERFNEAVLLDGSGEVLTSHRKILATSFFDLPEDIRPGRTIDLLDTPLGLVGIPICLDFCEEGTPIAQLWQEIGAEVLLVPALGPHSSLSAHSRRAETLVRSHGGISVVANQPLILTEPAPGFILCSNGDRFQLDGTGQCFAVVLPTELA